MGREAEAIDLAHGTMGVTDPGGDSLHGARGVGVAHSHLGLVGGGGALVTREIGQGVMAMAEGDSGREGILRGIMTPEHVMSAGVQSTGCDLVLIGSVIIVNVEGMLNTIAKNI